MQHSATWSSVIIAFDQRRQLDFAISDTARPADSPVWETRRQANMSRRNAKVQLC